MMILGIDPGLSGALALYDGDKLKIFDIPTVAAPKRGREVDWPELARIVDAAAPIAHAFLERAAARPGQGVSSMFKFGTVYGGLRGIVSANFIPITLVTPQTWKSALSVPRSKDGARQRASELLPRYSGQWQSRSHHGRAEAALIALYAWRQIGRAA